MSEADTVTDNLADLLNAKVRQYNTPAFIKSDPIQFPRRFHRSEDIEIAALLSATIAWGSRPMIIRSCERLLFGIMQGAPLRFVLEEWWRNFDGGLNIHRTFFMRDLAYICRGLHHIYNECSTMESVFAGSDMWQGIAAFRSLLTQVNGDASASLRHVPNPEKSACKRLHLMLRWLCRTDGIVDLGIWRSISPAQLIMPLDVHVARTSRRLGILTRHSNDRRAAEELTAWCRGLCPHDPTSYDFALFGLGVADVCC